MKVVVIIIVTIFTLSACTPQNSHKDKILQSKKLVDSAVNLIVQGNPSSRELQLQLLDSAIRLDSTNKSAISNKITVLFSMHRFDDIIKTINHFDPKGEHSDLLMLKGIINEEQYKDTARAQIYYGKALNALDSMCQTNPDNKGYQITRAFTILFAKGKLQGIKAYNALLDKYPGDSSILRIKNQFYDFDRRQYLKSLWR